MQRLARLHQDVVGDVHDVVVRPHTDGLQAALQPVGARPHLHAADNAGGVVRAQVQPLDLHAGGLARRFR